MKFDIYQIDAFTNQIFGGNPACVVPLKEWLDDDMLLNIAKENAVAETAFFIEANNRFHLRWFTPEFEMDLCGHATLASAHCLKTHLDYHQESVLFESKSGELAVTWRNEFYYLDFPSRKPRPSKLPEVIAQSISIQPREVLKSRDYVLIYNDEIEVQAIEIDRHLFDQINLDPGGVVVTAPGLESDFVSRFFTPQASILEDPVTGSAHCSLTPYWSEKFNKSTMVAQQLSARGGYLECEDRGDRIIIGGQAKTYLKGEFWIS